MVISLLLWIIKQNKCVSGKLLKTKSIEKKTSYRYRASVLVIGIRNPDISEHVNIMMTSE